MRLRPAKRMDDEDEVSGFGDREARRDRRSARRDRRRDKRDSRKDQRQERRLDRVDRRQEKVREKLSQSSSSSSTAPRYAPPVAAAPEPMLQPAPTTWPPPQPPKAKKKPGEWIDRVVDRVEEFVEDGELDPEDLEDEEDATEGIGAWAPLQRRRPAGNDAAWGPAVRMGRRLRIQAAVGYRAAVIDLKPGLFLVAEIPDGVTRTEFGLAPLLAPLMMTAARRAMDEPPRERRGPLASLFRRRREEPVRYVQVVQQPAPPAAAPLALPGPVEEPTARVVPGPDVGWADDGTIAAVYGCDCERNGR